MIAGLRSPLARRLIPLALVALGILLWRSSGFTQERELTWWLDGDRAGIERLEIQLWEGETLLKREEWKFQAGAPSSVTQRVSLAPGRYLGRVFVFRAGQAPHTSAQAIAVVESESAYSWKVPTDGR